MIYFEGEAETYILPLLYHFSLAIDNFTSYLALVSIPGFVQNGATCSFTSHKRSISH